MKKANSLKACMQVAVFSPTGKRGDVSNSITYVMLATIILPVIIPYSPILSSPRISGLRDPARAL